MNNSVHKYTSPGVYPADKTIVDLFDEQVAKTPDNIAVSFEGSQLTYKDLYEKSNQLSHYLRKSGVKEETLVPICIDRSLEMIIGIMGILKAGAAYVPIDPEYPDDRINYMLDDVKSAVLLTNSSCKQKLSGRDAHLLQLDKEWSNIDKYPRTNLSHGLFSQHLAYVIYTSGSTGKPKGVMNEHIGLLNRLTWAQDYFNLTESDAVLQKTTFCFDVSVWELLWPLITGAKLVFARPGGHKDTNYLKSIINESKITVLHFVPSMIDLFLYDLKENECKGLKKVLCSGEALKPSQVNLFRKKLPGAELHNLYGPTEAAIDVTCWSVPKTDEEIFVVPIGKPVSNTQIYIISPNNDLLPVGEEGELVIGGIQVARGYLNKPELTAERFKDDPFSKEPGARIYKTGDIAKWLPDGNIEYSGRMDDQVKIRGFRIELGEIENVMLQYPEVKNCVVIAKEDKSGDKRLIGYVVVKDNFDKAGLTQWMESKLPEYMIPRLLMQLDAIPLTVNGKADKKALPAFDASKLLKDQYVAATTKLEEKLAAVWKDILNVKKVGINDNFFELGGNSLLAIKTVADLKQAYGYNIPVTKIYQYPTINGLASYIEGRKKISPRNLKPKFTQNNNKDIAVISMAGRFPGANTIDELWTLLKEGKETTSFFTKEELDPFLPADLINDPGYVKARGIIENADSFDAAFFRLNPKLAETMDPQQRVFLEIAWEALENVGYLKENYNGIIGVFAGSYNNTYYLENIYNNKGLLDKLGGFQVMTYNEKDFVAPRVSYELNLKGPAISIHTACSTSLMAIAQAVESIRNGRCDVALAGGVSITVPVKSGHLYQEGAMLSKDGHCRSFDENAEGTVFSDGAGVVLLKSKEDAERDGDTIYAIIKGIGINNDGGGKGSFTAPSAEGQAGAITMAIDDAAIDPSTITYVEAHGTGTPIGDPIEVEGLKIAFGKQEKNQYCALGSIKSNMGHLTAAAGVTGFIKTVLALYNKQIPASINYKRPNPLIDFKNSPFYINDKLADWETKEKRRAGVSSFGVGGSNVHVVLEEFESAPAISSEKKRPLQLITWSAKTTTSRDLYTQKLASFLKYENINLSDAAYTLQTTRQLFKHRRFVVAGNTVELTKKLAAASTPPSEIKSSEENIVDVVFMFPGQGSQYINMGRDLYENEPVFKEAVDTCAELLQADLKEDIRDIIYPSKVGPEAEAKINNTYYTQPSIFVIEYAMAKLWMSWGVTPSSFIGHSIGEFVAAHLAGVFSLKDGLHLIATRGRLMTELPKGSMLSVRADHKKIISLLPSNISLAAINSPTLCVVAGPVQQVESFSKHLETLGISNKLLHTSHAFHSFMMDPVVEPFEEVVKSIKLSLPRIPIISTVTASWMSDADATDPAYWAKHLRSTVRFSEAVQKLIEEGNQLFLEAGPRNVASTLVRQHSSANSVTAMPSIDATEEQSEYYSLLKALGQLWMNGVQIDWDSFYKGQDRKKINVPLYAFDRKRCWIDPVITQQVTAPYQQQVMKAEPISINNQLSQPISVTTNSSSQMRKSILLDKLKKMLEDTSGIDMEGVTPDMSFIEIGLDSLLLTQVAINLKKEFGLPITFRQLNEEYGSLNLLASFLDANLPEEKETPQLKNDLLSNGVTQQNPTMTAPNNSTVELISQQIQLLAQQIALLNGSNGTPAPLPVQVNNQPLASSNNGEVSLTAEEIVELKKPFGATAKIEKHATALSNKQHEFLNKLIKDYTAKTIKSKTYTQQHRPYMADPRVVSGFKPYTKEIVYSIVVNRSKGSRLWDIDGNEYIDALNGFGSNFLGYQPDVITEAIKQQIDKGYEIGPQHELSGEVSKLICEFTNFDRAALCNTGSEAVLGAMRIARTVTGRSLIVAFTGSYHGIMDEVIVRGTKKLKTFPAAPGIMPEGVQNMLILDYGTDESLKIIKERAHELAAVLVEPVQSRRPEFQPVEFLKKLRVVTEQSGTALIFDEVITGFRTHPGGAQALFGIKADIGTYGKVAGAGISIGIIAGNKRFMDALDGGFWQYGDSSTPEVGVTYFAGTFVRHPLALAACKASLLYMKNEGPKLQETLNANTKYLADSLNAICQKNNTPLYIAQFSSLWKIKYHEEYPYSELLFTLMRHKGIHILDGFPCFLTTSHSLSDINSIIKIFEECVLELKSVGFIPAYSREETDERQTSIVKTLNNNEPPLPNARLGKDKDGNPAWFVLDANNPGKYLQIHSKI